MRSARSTGKEVGRALLATSKLDYSLRSRAWSRSNYACGKPDRIATGVIETEAYVELVAFAYLHRNAYRHYFPDDNFPRLPLPGYVSRDKLGPGLGRNSFFPGHLDYHLRLKKLRQFLYDGLSKFLL